MRQMFTFIHTLLICALSAQSVNGDHLTTPEGISYTLLKANNQGAAVHIGDLAQVVYTTSLEDGTPIAKVDDPKSPYAFVVGNGDVLPGWDIAIQYLHVGEKATFTIPSALAYGEKKFGKIPANANIVLELEILKAQPAFYAYDPAAMQKTQSGLKYLIKCNHTAKEETVPAGNYIGIQYTGYTIAPDGKRKIFDNSVVKGVAAMTQVGVRKFIPGLDEGLSMLHVGDSAVFIIPPALGYGAQANQLVPANSTLGFDVYVQESTDPFFGTENITYIHDNEVGYDYAFLKDSVGKAASINEIVSLDLVGYYLMPDNAKRIFQSTYETRQPQTFRIGRGIENPAWFDVLQKCSVGDQVIMAIPPDKARMELKKQVPENVTVFFEFTLRKIVAPAYIQATPIDTIITPSGTTIFTIVAGTGAQIDTSTAVYIHYTGYTIDSTGTKQVFQSTFDSGQPMLARPGKKLLITGWEEALLYLHEGDQVRVEIPAEAAYGSAGKPPLIMPNEKLYFDMYAVKVITPSAH